MNLGQDIDYEALAKQHGAISSMAAPKAGPNGEIDYEALAKQHGAIGSTPAPQAAPVAYDPAKDVNLTNMMGQGSPTQEQMSPIDEDHPAVAHGVAAFLHAIGLPASKDEYRSMADADAHKTFMEKLKDAPLAGPLLTINSLQAGGRTLKQAGHEQMETGRAVARGDITGAIAHQVGAVGYGAAGLLTPVGGQNMATAGEQFGKGDVSGGIGTTAGIIAPVVMGELLPKGTSEPLPPAADVLPKHVEALTGLIEDRGGTVDPHATASAALPTLRETAVRQGIDPSKLKGREAGQATLRVAEQSVRDTQNEFNDIRKPYNSVLVDQAPIAQAYRDAITPELLANAPKVARALETEAKRFDQPAPLDQINQFRTRMNRQLDALENRGTTAQIMSSDMERASRAAVNAARDQEYSTVGRLSGLDPDYIRGLKQREGALIEAKSSLTKEYNRTSGQQGEAVSEGLREKLTNTFPSRHGATKSVIKNLIGPKPIEVLNDRLSKMFAGMGSASELPSYEQVQPPAAPQIEGGPSGPLPGGESLVDELTRGGPGTPPPTAPDTSQTFARGGKMGTPQGIADQVVAAKSGSAANATARVDAHKVAKAAIGEQVQAPVAPVTTATGQITPEHVAAENAFYTQARAELGADASPSAVLQRAQALKIEHAAKGAAPPVTPVTPTMHQTLTQKMQARPLPTLRRVNPPVAPGGVTVSPRQQATALMLLVKQGKLTPAEADSKIQRLVGPGGRRTIRRPVGPE